MGLTRTRASPTRSGSTTRATTPPRSTSRASRARLLQNDFLAATVDMPRARLTTGARTRIVVNRNRLVARGRRSTASRPATRRARATCWWARPTPQGGAARERRAGRAVRGGARCGHPGAAALRLLAVPAHRPVRARARRWRAPRWSTSATARPHRGCAPRVGHRAQRRARAHRGRGAGHAQRARSRRARGSARCGSIAATACLRSVPLVTARGGAEGGTAAPGIGLPAAARRWSRPGSGIWLAVRRRRAGGVAVRRPRKSRMSRVTARWNGVLVQVVLV